MILSFIHKNDMLGSKIISKDVLDSTNNYTAKLILEGRIEHGTVILAGKQEAGKGQRGSKWDSEPYENLLFSLYLKHDRLAVSNQFILSMCVSNACVSFLKAHIPNAQIKWPNDLLVNSAKIAGILIENTLENVYVKHSIVGIGLNVNQRNFGPYNATSLVEQTQKHFTIEQVAIGLCAHLDEWYTKLKTFAFDEIRNFYLSNLWLLNKESEFESKNERFWGMITDVKPTGELVIFSNQQERSFQHKEVVFIARKN